MSITVNLRYKGKNGAAMKFVQEMISSGTVEAIRKEKGNLKYEYFQSIDDAETVLLQPHLFQVLYKEYLNSLVYVDLMK